MTICHLLLWRRNKEQRYKIIIIEIMYNHLKEIKAYKIIIIEIMYKHLKEIKDKSIFIFIFYMEY